MSVPAGWEAVIGLEIHVQLSTESKCFCPCPNRFGAEPNTLVCPVCMGHPGTLPVLNRQAVAFAVRSGLALECRVAPRSLFARKNYFYPDLPKGYQISQYDQPICSGGRVPYFVDDGLRFVRLTRIHMEEDAGKNSHGDDGWSRVDFNRAGTPLVEIVTEPDLRDSGEAMAFLRALRSIVRYLGVSDGNMEEGSLRCDANVSVRRQGATELGTKVEIKNVNSFKFVGAAIDYEVERQVALLEAGGAVEQETRGWDSAAKLSRGQRGKEGESDYRYFADPDLPPLVIPPEWLEQERALVPELPHQKVARYVDALGLTPYDARVLSAERALAEWFERAVETAGVEHAKAVANWTQSELWGLANDAGVAPWEGPVRPEALARLVLLVADGSLSSTLGKKALDAMWASGEGPDAVVERLGLKQLSDVSAIDGIVAGVLDAHPGEVAELLAGKDKLMGFFVGQVMRQTRGKANPQLVNERLRALLEQRRA